MWAQIAVDGTVVGGSTGVTVTKGVTGTYIVFFPTSVKKCAVVVTPVLGNLNYYTSTGVFYRSDGAIVVDTWRGYDLLGAPAWIDAPISVAAFC